MRSLSTTSPLYYLRRLNQLELLTELLGLIAVPGAVIEELANGRQAGYEVLSVQPAEELPAHERGLIESLAPYLDKLRTEGFYLSEPLYRRLLGDD